MTLIDLSRRKEKQEANELKTTVRRPLEGHPLAVHACKRMAAIWNNV